jgi:HTH-type transcriptional regulator, sugar sensing transcriptional regulator
MELSEVLKKAGLNDKEAKVYLALLELGVSSAYKIAPKAGLKRPITYIVLESLKARGLVSVVPQGEKNLYVAAEPGKIMGELERTRELYKRFLPNLEALHNESGRKEKPKVQFFEGKEAVGELYEKIIASKEVEFFSTIKDIISVFPEYPKRLNERAFVGQMRIRELLTKNPGDVAYAKTMKHNQYFEHRFAPGAGEFLTDNCLFDGNVAFFSFQPFIYAVLIQSQGIYKSLRSLFEFSWQAGEPHND